MTLFSFGQHLYNNLDLLNLCFLFTITCFVNKYVLSVLKFMYPTIFQGWQTLVGVVFIQAKIMLGQIDPILDGNNRTTLLLCLPELVLFVMSIYSGSKALANITIPAFLAVCNSCLLMKRISRCFLHKTIMLSDPFGWLVHGILGFTILGVLKTDPTYHNDGYFWMYVHIACLGAIFMFIEINKDILKLSKTKLLFYNYIFSVFVFAPCSYLLGDAAEAVNFQHLSLYRFYFGCLFSGVFGVLLNLHHIKLQDSKLSAYGESICIAQIVASVVSVPLFHFPMTKQHAMWIVANQLSTVFIASHCKSKHTEPKQTSQGEKS